MTIQGECVGLQLAFWLGSDVTAAIPRISLCFIQATCSLRLVLYHKNRTLHTVQLPILGFCRKQGTFWGPNSRNEKQKMGAAIGMQEAR